MEYKQSISVAFSNFGLVFKLLFYFLIVSIIFVALASAIIIPTINQIRSNRDIELFVSDIKDDLQTFLKGNASIDETYYSLKDDVAGIVQSFFDSTNVVAFICIGIFLVYVIYRFLMTLSFLPTTDILNNFMTSNLKYGFMSNYTLNLRRSAAYSLAKVLISIPVDAVIMFLIGGSLIGLWEIINVFSLPFVFAAAVFLLGLRDAMFAGWLPRIIYHPEEKVWTALKNSVKETNDYRKTLIAAFCCETFLYFALSAAFALPTLGVMVVIALPTNYVMIRIIELVCFYKNNRMKFYTDANTVVDTVAVGLRENVQEKSGKEKQ
jgi:hypothetical protein